MVKLIEDILFPNDSYKIVKEIIIKSDKRENEKVIIKINEL